MLQQSVFIQNFGNCKIKIWSYPKDVLRSLIIGLKRDSKTLHKISNVMGFKHVYNEYENGCNCKDKIEHLCLKLSINAHRYGKIYIPLDVFDTNTCTHKTFLCELKSGVNHCKSHISKSINVINENDRNIKCLLKLLLNSKIPCNKESNFENPHYQVCPDKININKFIKTSDNLDRNERFSIDIAKIIELCLKFDIPPEEIICLLKSFKDYQQNDIINEPYCKGFSNVNECDNSDENDYHVLDCKKPLSSSRFSSASGNNNRIHHSANSKRKHTKHFTIARSPSPRSFTHSCIDDCETDFTRSLSPDNVCSEYQDSLISGCGNVMKFRNQGNALRMTSTMVERDIHDIKGILKDIIALLRKNGHENHEYENECQFDEYKLEVEDCKTSREIETLHSILEEWIRRKNIDLNAIQNKNTKAKKPPSISRANQCQEMVSKSENIPMCEEPKQVYYRNSSPKSQTRDHNIAIRGTFNGRDQNEMEKNLSVKKEFPNETIKTALISAGVPPQLSDQICQMSLNGKGTGVTNIYYYINSDGEPNSAKHHKKRGKLHKETEIVIEQQRLRKLDKNEKKANSENYSQIIVDVNNPQPKLNKDGRVDNDNDNSQSSIGKDHPQLKYDNDNPVILKGEKIIDSAENSEPKRRSLRRVKQAKFDENNGCTTKKT